MIPVLLRRAGIDPALRANSLTRQQRRALLEETMEKACKAEEVPGRLIPVPRVISAGCGLAWAAPLEAVEQIKHVMQEKGIEREELHECMV